MAEPFSIATGVLQVAEIGFSLAKALYEYGSSVRDSQSEIKRLAREVKITAKALDLVHRQVQADTAASEKKQLLTRDGLDDLQDAVDGCREAFEEVCSAVGFSARDHTKSEALVLPISRQLKWPFKAKKREAVQANLERLKSTLVLMLSVLQYGSKQSHRIPDTQDAKMDTMIDKFRIASLIDARSNANELSERLAHDADLPAYHEKSDILNEGAARSPSRPNDQRLQKPQNIQHSTMQVLAVSPGMQKHNITKGGVSDLRNPPASQEKNNPKPQTLGADQSLVFLQLSNCASAVGGLSTDLDAASRRWLAHETLDYAKIEHSLHHASQSIANLNVVHGVHLQKSYAPSASSMHRPEPPHTKFCGVISASSAPRNAKRRMMPPFELGVVSRQVADRKVIIHQPATEEYQEDAYESDDYSAPRRLRRRTNGPPLDELNVPTFEHPQAEGDSPDEGLPSTNDLAAEADLFACATSREKHIEEDVEAELKDHTDSEEADESEEEPESEDESDFEVVDRLMNRWVAMAV